MRVFMLFFISGNSKPSEGSSEWDAALDRHGSQRICKLRTAAAAHPVGLTLQREHTAEVNVVTPKQKIKNSQEDCHNSPLRLLRLLMA